MCSRFTEAMCKYYIVSYRGREPLWIWIAIRAGGMTGSHFLRNSSDNTFLNVSWIFLKVYLPRSKQEESGEAAHCSWVGMLLGAWVWCSRF